MKLLLDTNILVDYYSRRQPFFQDAKLLRTAALFNDVELWCSIQSFTDIEYILRGAFLMDDLRNMMLKSLDFLKVSSPTAAGLEEGLTSGWADLEDYLIASCAERVKADYIITRDREGFADSKIPAVSPSEFFEIMACDFGIVYDEIDF